MHVHPGIEQDVGAHHPADGPRCPDHGHGGIGLGNDLRRGRRQAAEHVEQREAAVPHGIFHVVAEDPQEPHVADEMEPAAVEEHRCQGRVPHRRVAEHADGGRSHREARPGRDRLQQFTRNQTEPADRTGQRGIGAQSLNENPRQGVEPDDRVGRVRRQDLRVVVTYREQGCKSRLSVRVIGIRPHLFYNAAVPKGIGSSARRIVHASGRQCRARQQQRMPPSIPAANVAQRPASAPRPCS